ncbi:MAG: Wzz/FepE/Etk N-terminal domain-containing protein, partial [Bacteroidota bacterium]
MKSESINIKKNDDEIDLRQLFLNVRRKWHYFIVSLIVFAAAAFCYIRFTLPVYEASSSVLVKDSKNASKNIEDFIAGDVFGNNKNIATEMGILQSRSLLEETINELNLEVSYYSKGTFFKQPLYKNNPFSVKTSVVTSGIYGEYFELTIIDSGRFNLETEIGNNILPAFKYNKAHRFGEEIRTPFFSIVIDKVEPEFSFATEKNFYFKINSMNSLINYYKDEKLKVNPLNKDATIVTLSVQDNIKERAMDFLNKLGEVYINRDVRDKAAVAGLTLKFVDEQLIDISKTLGGIEQDLQKFKEEKGTVNLSQESQAYLERLTNIDADRVKAQMDLASLDYLYDYVVKNKDLAQLAP